MFADEGFRVIARRWIVMNALSAGIGAIAALTIYAVRQATGADAVDAGGIAVAAQYAIALTLSALSGAASGVLTGSVLQRMLPALPVVSWVALHALIGCLLGFAAERIASAPSSTIDPPGSLAEMIASGLITGAAFGAVFGSVEALVLRTAVASVTPWIIWSVIAVSTSLGAFFPMMQAAEALGGFAGAVANVVLSAALEVSIAVLILPALAQLRPRDQRA
jgi:hypothetical protein